MTYNSRMASLKKEVIDSIGELMEKAVHHKFKSRVYIHYIEGEVATTELCTALETYSGGGFGFITESAGLPDVQITTSQGSEHLMGYDFESIVSIYEKLTDELRKEKIAEIKKILADNSNLVQIPSSMERCIFSCGSDGVTYKHIMRFAYTKGGKLTVKADYKGEPSELTEDSFELDELERMAGIIKEALAKKFRITALNLMSRTFEVTAGSYEEAVEKVKRLLSVNPLNEREDGNGLEFT